MANIQQRDLAKKKITKNANPIESKETGAYYPVESSQELEKKSSQNVGQDDDLKAGFCRVDLEVDPFDNERNYFRMRPELAGDVLEQKDERTYDSKPPSPGYGPKKKVIDRDEDGEDYGK